MGTEFWWFYDVIAVAVLLVCIFLAGKKGFLRGTFTAISCAVAMFVSFAVSGTVSQELYKNTIRSSNVRKIEKNLRSDTFTLKYADYLENMGYFIKVSTEKLEDVFEADGDLDRNLCNYINNINARKAEENESVLLEKVREGYAVVISDIITQSLNKFAGETAGNEIRNDSSGMQELILLMLDKESLHNASVYIADNYTAKAYGTIFRLTGFVLIYIAVYLILLAVINSFTGRRERSPESTVSHISGGFMGIITGGIMIFAVAVVIRLWAIMGSNEMLFFNNDVVDRTFIFRYFYDLTLEM
ncbi:MAG: hypothetical protein NC340_02700 [Ruminococcus flavefaciens]|nr:hypothetical protein [Ruminococcus flavefaciens]MCM1229410.1 hypothetical protein [Ruminococcus flavefaciens]